MTNGKISDFLIPNVSKVSNKKSMNKDAGAVDEVSKEEFKKLLNQSITENVPQGEAKQIEHGVILSKHAARRLEERDLKIDNNEYLKIRDAINKLKQKGGQDSLVITDKAAYIVDVNNNKIVTAIDKDNMAENVFTKIDSTLVI